MARNRGNGEGSVYPRKNKNGKIIGWRGSYFDLTGKRSYVSGRTRRDTEARLTKAKADRNAGLVFESGTVSLAKYLKRWLEDIQDTVSPRTWERYEQNVRLHIVPELGRMKLASLTAANVRGLLQRKRASGLAPRTVFITCTRRCIKR